MTARAANGTSAVPSSQANRSERGPLASANGHRSLTSDADSLADLAGRPFPAHLERIVTRLLAKDPSGRYKSGTELAAELRSPAAVPHEAPTGAQVPPSLAIPRQRSELPTVSDTPAPPAASPAASSFGAPVSLMRPESSVVQRGVSFSRKQTQLALGDAVRALSNESSVMVTPITDEARLSAPHAPAMAPTLASYGAYEPTAAAATPPIAPTMEMPHVATPSPVAQVAARPKLEASQRLDPADGTLLRYAWCEEELGNLATSWVLFRDGLARAKKSNNAARIKFAEDHLAAIEPKLSKVIIHVSPPADINGLELRWDGKVLGRGEWNSLIRVFLPDGTMISR